MSWAGWPLAGAEGGRADRPEPFPSTPVVFVGQVLGLLALGSRLRVCDEPAAFSSLGPARGPGHRSPRHTRKISWLLSQKIGGVEDPRRIRSTRRLGLRPKSRRALCWHRPPVLLPRGATRAKLCKCRQGRTPQNFDRVLAAACLYRDMLIPLRIWAEYEAFRPRGASQ